jgi:pimeloyl-ACP methyl ester carboxylesterase
MHVSLSDLLTRILRPVAVTLLALACSGCTPGRFLAGRLAGAPNQFPTWFAPEPRVYLGFPPRITESLPIETLEILRQASVIGASLHHQPSPESIPIPPNPASNARAAQQPLTLAFRIVPPADYQIRVAATNWIENGLEKAEFTFQRKLPAPPLPPEIPRRGTVFLLHGYGLDQDSMLPWAFWLGERGWLSVLVDLRGHGRSTGSSVSFGPVEAADLQTLLDHLIAQNRVPGPVIALGVSYGGALALRWTASDPRLDSAIAIAPYDRLDAAAENLRSDFASWLPRSWVRHAVQHLPAVLKLPRSELDTRAPMGRRRIPALLLAGGNDRIAPVSEVEHLHNLASPGSRLWVLDGSNHEALPYRFPEITPPIARWLEERLDQPSPAPQTSH